MRRLRRLVVFLLVALLPVQGALAASKILCASTAATDVVASDGQDRSHHAAPAAHGHAKPGHDHAKHGHATHGHGPQADADAPGLDASPASPDDDSRTCKLCAACSFAAAVTFVPADRPHAQPDGAVDAPLAPAVPRGRAERLDRPPKSA